MPITDEQFGEVFSLVELAFYHGNIIANEGFPIDKKDRKELSDKYSDENIKKQIRKIFGGEA
jgi:hypothetical protein